VSWLFAFWFSAASKQIAFSRYKSNRTIIEQSAQYSQISNLLLRHKQARQRSDKNNA
jgi:hypothetical protein